MKPDSIFEAKFDDLQTSVYQNNDELGMAAAEEVRGILENIIRKVGEATVILATGNSQLTFLGAMRAMPMEWSKVNFFHMDEYVGLDPAHPASFPLFLKRRFLDYIQSKTFFPMLPGMFWRLCQERVKQQQFTGP